LMENAHWQQTLAAHGITLWSNRALQEWPVRPETAGFIVLTVIIGALISYFAAHDISKHLDEIREATRRIANGDFAHRLHMITDDEVQELAGSINAMATELESKIEQLQKARDTAQQKSMELEEANKELLQLDELKSNFLSNISHELKAPLVSTKGYVDFILSEKMGTLNAKQQKGLKVARDNLILLSRLISSLLDFSKLSGGAMKLRRRPTRLKELIESCVESFRLEVREKGKDLDFDIVIHEPSPTVSVDPDRIREVFMNLLDNAGKFTESRGRITLSAEEPAQDDDFVQISIGDTGIGISKKHQTKVFQRFYQVDGSSTRKYGGTGLGLAIVKEILEAHGCTIRVESEVGRGSKFIFMLPIHHSFHPFLAEQSDLAYTKPQTTRLIEVIEDDPQISSVVKALLEEEGFAVIPAHTGTDALRIARQHKPDLITLDIYLPDMNGFDLLAELHKDPATQPIPVIVLSILVDKEKGLQLGATDYLEKPIDAEKLRDVIKRVSSTLDGVPEMVDQIKRQFPSTQS
jgi:signal transduction histidine kinase/CheY-like chemotaxis protein